MRSRYASWPCCGIAPAGDGAAWAGEFANVATIAPELTNVRRFIGNAIALLVLTLMPLLCYSLFDKTSHRLPVKHAACAAIVVDIFVQWGGFPIPPFHNDFSDQGAIILFAPTVLLIFECISAAQGRGREVDKAQFMGHPSHGQKGRASTAGH
jgi:hypothetical protein